MLPSDPPSKTDPAASDARIRKEICEDIIRSEFLPNFYHWIPHKTTKLLRPGYSDIFHQIYSSSDKYTNSYKKYQFHVSTHVDTGEIHHYFKEYAFVCPIKDEFGNEELTRAYYVSKEYNVSSFSELYMPGRFLFGTVLAGHGYPMYCHAKIFAEAPARADTETSLDIELQYLRIRKYTQSGTNVISIDEL